MVSRDTLKGMQTEARTQYLIPEPGKVIIGNDDGIEQVDASGDGRLVRGAEFDAVGRSPIGTMLPVALDEAAVSLAVQLLGDSTGAADDKWAQMLMQDLAAAYTAYEVRHYQWNSVSLKMREMPLFLRGAPNGERRVTFSGVANQTPSWTAPAITGDIDVRARILPGAWPPAAQQLIAAQFHGTGNWAWRFGLKPGGSGTQLIFDWTTDGTSGTLAPLMTANLPQFSTPTWVRVALDVDNGSGQHTGTFYSSTDGTTWTQLGTTWVRSGTTSIFNSTAAYELAGRGGTGELFVGSIYDVQIREGGTDGPMVTPALPEHWLSGGATPAPSGSPVLTLVNGSHPGADITYLADTRRMRQMTPNYGQVLTIISSSHNELGTFGPVLHDEIKTYLAAVAGRLPGVPVVTLTQNPRIAPATHRIQQARRRVDYIAWARSLGWTPIDTYGAFLADPRGVAALLQADGFHPNVAGARVWADAVKAALGLA